MPGTNVNRDLKVPGETSTFMQCNRYISVKELYILLKEKAR